MLQRGSLEETGSFALIALRALLPEVVVELRSLTRNRAVLAYDELRQDFRAAFPELHAALGAIPYSDGQLRTTRQARNYEAEERRAEDSKEGRELLRACEAAEGKGPGVVKACNRRLQQWIEAQGPIFRTVTQEAGPLSGGAFLIDPRLLAHSVATAAAASALPRRRPESQRS